MEPKRVSVCVLLHFYLTLTSSSDVFYQLRSPTPLVINFNRSSFSEFYDCLACTTGCSCSMATEDYEIFNLTLNPNAGSTEAASNLSLPNNHYCIKHCSLELASTSKFNLRFWRINCNSRPTNKTCFFDVGVKGFNLLLCWKSNTSFSVTFDNSTHLQGDCITRNIIDLQSMNDILESTRIISFRGSDLTSETSLYQSWSSSLIEDHNVPTLHENLNTISTTLQRDVVLATSVVLQSLFISELNDYFDMNTKPHLITSFTTTPSLSRLSVIATQGTSLLTNEITSKSDLEMPFTYLPQTPTYAVTPFQRDSSNEPPKSRTIIIILCTVIGILLLTFSIVIYYLVRKRLRRKTETESREINNLNGGIGTPVKTTPSNSNTGHHYSTIRPSYLHEAALQPYNISSRKTFPENSYPQDNPKSSSTLTRPELKLPPSSRSRLTSKHKPGDVDASIYDTVIDDFSEESLTEETMNSDVDVRPYSSARVSIVRPYSVVTLSVAQDPSSTSKSTKMIQFKDKYFYLTHSDIGQYASDKSSDTTVYNESHKSQSNSSGCETLSADGSFQYIVKKHPSAIDGDTDENNSMNHKLTITFPYARLNELNRSFENVYNKGL